MAELTKPVIAEEDLARIGAETVDWAKGHYTKGMTKKELEAALTPETLKAAPGWVHDLVDVIWDLL